MKTVGLLVSLVLSLVYVRGQSPTREQLIGTWIGVHTEWDTDVTCPLPIYLKLETDSTYHLGMVDGSAAEKVSTWAVTNRVVRLDTIHYAPKLVQRQNDLLRIGVHYPMVFRRFQDVAIDSATAYKQLAGGIWQSDSLSIRLYTNGRVSLENVKTKQRTAHFWQLSRFGTSVFLVISGNSYNRDGGYKPLWQITGLSAGQFRAVSHNGRAAVPETFRFARKIPLGDSCQPSGFQPCHNCFARMWHGTLLNSDKKYTIKQILNTHFQPVNKPGQSGLVRVRFVINCQGERGLFEVAGFDDDYCPRTFDPQIVDQLVRICRDYIPANLSNYSSDQLIGEPLDSATSLTFKFKDGRLTDILP
ncbi:hypothetical protein ACFSUS_11340 [Spirosoma soli]|uniref:TonB C-terminal domain-containing protein n=1 Tax=Spirosoma soli TaxID=1770529 RepID=A0ABW5M4I8_9BACT